jgi:hypothetical protein
VYTNNLSNTVCVYFLRRRRYPSFLGVHEKRTWRRCSNEQPKYSLNGRLFIHAAGASLHQPKYSHLKNGPIFMSHSFPLRIVGVDVHPFFPPRMNVTRQTSRRPHRAPPNQQPSAPQTSLYLHAAGGASLHQPKVLTPLKRCNLHVPFALHHIMGVEFHLWSSSHAYMTSSSRHRARSTGHQRIKYAFDGPIHDACEEGKDGVRLPFRPL